MEAKDILIQAVISEKSMDEASKGRFTFLVVASAKKPEIKNAIEKQFNVHVTGMQTLIIKGKRARVGKRRTEINYTNVKKAIVALKSGEKIALFDVQTDEEKTEKK